MDCFRAGQTLDLIFKSGQYPPNQGWTGTFYLAPLLGGTGYNVTATTLNNDFEVKAAPSITATWTAGEYRWFFQVANSDSYILEEGIVKILPQISALSGIDSRSTVKKVLDALNSLIEGKATKDIETYSIAGRSLTKMNMRDVLRWQKYYKELYRRELADEARQSGLKTGTRVVARF